MKFCLFQSVLYCYGQQLRSCQDGQILGKVLEAGYQNLVNFSFTTYCQMPYFYDQISTEETCNIDHGSASLQNEHATNELMGPFCSNTDIALTTLNVSPVGTEPPLAGYKRVLWGKCALLKYKPLCCQWGPRTSRCGV